jgi:alpha-amylase
MNWHWEHFTGTDWDEESKKKQIYRLLGENKYWASSVDKEKGNFDYLMFADIDHNHPEVAHAKDVADCRLKMTSRNGPCGSPTNFNSVGSVSTPSSTFPKISSSNW